MLNKAFQGMKGLLSGMALTLGYFLRPGKVITQQYPENRAHLKLPPRSRSRIELVHDEAKGGYICTGCGVCVRACPNGSIEVVRGKDPVTKKPVLEKYVYHFERCTVCGLCVDACHPGAIRMGQDFEGAVYDSTQLTMILNENALPAKPAPETGPGPAPAGPPPSSPEPK
jgi:NADH-quinone oxidoreductase subunit I